MWVYIVLLDARWTNDHTLNLVWLLRVVGASWWLCQDQGLSGDWTWSILSWIVVRCKDKQQSGWSLNLYHHQFKGKMKNYWNVSWNLIWMCKNLMLLTSMYGAMGRSCCTRCSCLSIPFRSTFVACAMHQRVAWWLNCMFGSLCLF